MMVKKILLGVMAVITTAVIIVGIVVEVNRPKTDIEIMKDYVEERYGEEYYGKLYADDGDDMVEFVVYDENGKDYRSVMLRRSMFD